MAKPRSSPTPRKRSEGGFLLGIFTGVVIGLAVALGIAFYLNKAPMPFLSAKTSKPEPKSDGKGAPIAGLPQGSSAAAPAGEKPKFDFYKILPGQEETVSEKELQARAQAASRGQQESSKDVYFIQAGSFQNRRAWRAARRLAS